MMEEAKLGITTFTMPSDREVVATRLFDAPQRLAWQAHIECEHVRRWMLGPEGWTMPVCEMDVRPGGTWRYVWRRENASEMEMTGEFVEVVRPERLVQTERWGRDWPETLNTTVFTEDAEGRTILRCTVLYPSTEARDAAIETGMEDGWSVGYDRLDEHLSVMARRTPSRPS